MRAVGTRGDTSALALPPPMALLGLLVLLGLAGPVRGTWDTCKGTCGLWPMASDHSSAAGTSRVVRGTRVHPGAWPGIVSIQATWENGTWHMCSGVLLSSQWVLTVAHCFARAGDFSTWKVVVGTTDLTQLGPEAEVRHIQRLLVHQHYVPATARNDIALVELEQPVECSDYIQLGCVPDASLRVSELKSCYIAGWDFANARGLGMVLHEAKVHLMDTELCNSSRWYTGDVHPNNLCVGYPQGSIDTCKGDSGGPLVCKDNEADYFWLVGMSSWGRGCEKARHPGIYTSTQHFYNWILLQTGLSPADIAHPAPKPSCTPTPEPGVTLTSAETPMPEPQPTPEPVPEPVLVPEPTPEPEPTPVTELTPEPELVSEPTLELEPVTEPIPVPEPEPELVSEPTLELEPVTEPIPVPEPTLELEPVTEPIPVPEPEPELVSEPTLELEPVTEPIPVPEPEPELVPQPTLELEPVTEPTPVPEPEPELVSEPTLELEPVMEPIPVPEPEPELVPEPEPEVVPEPTPEPDSLVLISVPYRSLVKFCDLLGDFLQFLKDQLR